MTIDDLRPATPCPKCGGAYGLPRWQDAESHYDNGIPGGHDWFTNECLVWSCLVCGHAVETKTLEQLSS